jgi:hypothetical protein
VPSADLAAAAAAMKDSTSWALDSRQAGIMPDFLQGLKQQHAAANAGKEGGSLLGAYALAHSALQALSLLAVLGSLHQVTENSARTRPLT